MDEARRETSLFMGVGLVVAIVAAVFFSMTMALRQTAQRRDRWRELRTQIAQAERQASQAPPAAALDQAAAQAQQLARRFVTPEQIPEIRQRVGAVAESLGGALILLPATTPAAPTAAVPGFEGCYEVLSLVGTLEAPYRELAAFLAAVSSWQAPVVGIRSCTVTPALPKTGAAPEHHRRLKARLVLETYRWIPEALPKTAVPPPAAPEPPPEPLEAVSAWLRDPFDARYVPAPGVEGIVLHGILWDAARPTCLINGVVLGPGGVVNGYTVAVITPEAVVLRSATREFVLAIPA